MLNNVLPPLLPTHHGYIDSVLDALLLFESCLNGSLNHVPRPPYEHELQQLSRSGSIFIYEEHSSGIQRWTDDIYWSPGRTVDYFLIYRELDEPTTPSEQNRAFKQSQHSLGGIRRHHTATSTLASSPPVNMLIPREEQGSLGKVSIGSGDYSNNLKAGGLIKKTISVTIHGVIHHLVSYYSVDDILNNSLPRPSHNRLFQHTMPRSELFQEPNIRASLQDVCANGSSMSLVRSRLSF